MPAEYPGVTTRFLRQDERLMTSKETELPLVIEANGNSDVPFLQDFLRTHSDQIYQDAARYGAVLLRGFQVKSDHDFENSMLSLQGLKGISEAFMSEHGRTHVGDLKYVLHTNAAYKTGGTLYLGGFHTENYYSPDVPGYIAFCCLKPSELGGETGLINVEKVYQHLDTELKQKLEKQPYFVAKWLVSDVAKRYKISAEKIEEICRQFDLPVMGEGNYKFVVMYKTSVMEHPVTQKKALHINLFEVDTLNEELRKCFMNDYQGKTWFWHRFVWRLPKSVFKVIENIYVFFAALFYSPRQLWQMTKSRWNTYKAARKLAANHDINQTKVGSCFTDADVKDLAQLMRDYYSSCLWQPGDIILVDNRKVAHAGMPGSGERVIRALIGNPIEMKYSQTQSGCQGCKYRDTETIGFYVSKNKALNNKEIFEEMNI